ncbi:protein translocase subunit SecD [Candidatus Curculioniphilus buchneri]|uniref:protein translocase subunit SecD n=1 Tax=Candidatus Curculioniphilus buchneri TaxID=690594 RepID=UPI00376EB68D
MLNHYPLWKYIMLILALCIGILYSLPNLYGEDPAVQISGTRGSEVNESTLIQVKNILNQHNITSKSIVLENSSILALFSNFDMQLYASEILSNTLNKNYIVALNLAPAMPSWLKLIGAKPMKLGLDLRGGVHFLIEVDINTALIKLQEDILYTLCRDLSSNNIFYEKINQKDNYSSEIFFRNTAIRDQAISRIESSKNWNFIIKSLDDQSFCIALTDDYLRAARENTLKKNISILRNRINHLGITESLVQRQGTDRIIVELPGIQDMAQAKDILGATATLEFRLVHDNSLLKKNNDHKNHIPNNLDEKMTRNGDSIMLHKKLIMTGDHIVNATCIFDEFNQPQVNISLDNIGGNIMSKITKDNIGKLMATLFVEYQNHGMKDTNGRSILTKYEEIINIATIQSQFSDKFRIIGFSNPSEARQLSILMRAGTLMAPIQIIEECIIGPTLGLQNITQGVRACGFGLIVSIIFMIIWYHKFGLIAITALLSNLIMIIGTMSILPGITLTMPGIAGIVLTLAIAVDANVLINERIKEELRHGRTVQQAIHEGYRGALSSIVDANITTLITAIILYTVGAGSIKGFAITTIIGVVTSMFTAITGTRAIVNLLYGGKYIKKLSI